MSKFMMTSRVVLIAFCIYGIFKICTLLKDIVTDTRWLIAIFTGMLVFAMISLIDWSKKK